MRSVIRGTGMYIPPQVVTNDRLSKIMDTSHEWIRKRSGIEQRHYAPLDQATSDMAVPACRQAIEASGVAPEEIDYLVLATMTPDHYFPGSGVFVQAKLGLEKVPCLDIRQQCAGFVYGLQMADALIRSGQAKNVLLVGAEVHSCFMPWKAWDVVMDGADRTVDPEEYAWNTQFRDRTVLFGDGAGACVVTAHDGDDKGLIDLLLHTDGTLADRLQTPAGGSAYRPYFDPSMTEDGTVVPVVHGREVYRLAVTLMPEAVTEILERNGFGLDDLALVVMHQANLRINEAAQHRLGLPDDKVFNNIQKYGNTTAGTIPIAYHEALQQGRVSDGDLVCFVALGSGVHWGAALYRV